MIIVADGMPRSGSTLLFNIIREILAVKYGHGLVISSWKDVPDSMDTQKHYVVKTHVLGASHLNFPIFYSYRDVRTAMLSNYKKFGELPNIQWARKYVYEWQKAKQFSKAAFSFEVLSDKPVVPITTIANFLDISVEPGEVFQAVVRYREPDEKMDPVTMLHPSHRIFVGPNDFRSTLDVDLQKNLLNEFSWWFEECNYPTY